MCSLVSKIRNARAEQEIAPKEKVALTFWCDDVKLAEVLQQEKAAIAWLSKADPEQIKARNLSDRGEGSPDGVIRSVVSDGLEVDIVAPEKEVDVEKELHRLTKQLDFVVGMLAKSDKQITPTFLDRAPKPAVERALQKREEYQQQKVALMGQLEGLRALEQPTRRDVLAGLGLVVLARPRPAEANVGEGDILPQGARQEERIRKGLEAWTKKIADISTIEMTETEWDNLQGFLRRLYGLNDDMNFLARGFPPDKRKQAE